MCKQLVIFDLDGTLLDTIADLAMAANHALRMCGYPVHSVETLRTFVGNGIGKLLERSLPLAERTEENVERLRAEFIPYYNEHNTDLSMPYPGVQTLLGRLAACGVMLAVASNKYQVATEKLVKYYFPEIPFAEVYG
nr:HAD hydrolase-like protein [Bacteroidaceae bacterium]